VLLGRNQQLAGTQKRFVEAMVDKFKTDIYLKKQAKLISFACLIFTLFISAATSVH
jgi:hypothetical protein